MNSSCYKQIFNLTTVSLIGVLLSLTNVRAQNLILNPTLEAINLKCFDELWVLNGQPYKYEECDTTSHWSIKDRSLTGLYVKDWNYRNTTDSARGYSGYYSDIGLARSGNNLAVIQVFKSWSKSATVENVAAHLCQPLTAGGKYKVTLHIKPLHGNHFTDNIGFWFTDKQLALRYEFDPKTLRDSVKKGLIKPFDEPDHTINRIITDTSEYTAITYEYLASGGETYLYMGNLFFKSDQFWRKRSWQQVEQFGHKANRRGWMVCYYGVDDVSVERLDGTEKCTTTHIANKESADKPDTFLLEQIYFEFDKAYTSYNWEELNARISKTGNLKALLVVGYTDKEGTSNYNRELSKQRAVFIQEKLQLSNEIAVTTIGMGVDQVTTNTNEDSAKRRVDIILVH